MRVSALVALVAVLVATSSDALGLLKRSGPLSFDRPIYFDLKRRAFLQPRAEPRVLSLQVQATTQLWAVSISLGASNQRLILSLDTGVADTWINSATSDECVAANACSQLGGSFNPQSSTPVSQSFQYTYRDGTQTSGDYYRDTLRIAGQSLENFEFVVGSSAKPTIGKLGLSYPAGQVITASGLGTYPTIFDILANKGLIGSQSFSLWLDSATSGQLIFGGVDTTRYSGDLGVVPIQRVDGVFQNFAISLTGITLSDQGQSFDPPSGATTLPVNVVLNSGSLFTYLPTALVDDIWKALQYAGSSKQGGTVTAFVDCRLATSGITVDFVFGSVQISIPLSGLLFDFNVYKQTDRQGNQVCALKIRPADDGNYVLGLSFFEVAYIVFDLTNNQISLAPAVRGVSESNIIEVGQSPDSSGENSGGGETGNNNGGAPNLDGLTLVDPKDYSSLNNGVFIPYEDYIASQQGDQSGSGSAPGGGTFLEIDPKDFNKINPADLITYDQFIASLGGSAPTNTAPQTPTNNNNAATTQQAAPSDNGNDQVFPGSEEQDEAGADGTPQDDGTADQTDGTPQDPGTASGIGTTTVIEGGPQNSVLVDPITGLPVDQSIIGGDDPFGDDGFGDPLGGGIFKRVPAPAAQRQRRGFF